MTRRRPAGDDGKGEQREAEGTPGARALRQGAFCECDKEHIDAGSV